MEDASLLLVEEGDKPYVPPILQSDVAPCECTAPRLSMVVIMATAVAQSFAIAGLTATMALYLSDWLGFSEDNATIGVSLFNVLYTVLAPLAGVLSDIWFGNYLCQFWSGWLWALGSVLVLLTTIPAVVGGSFGDPTTAALILCVCGLVLVALGYAVINVIQSVFVGDQYLEHESKELASSFSSYYMFANVGNLLGESICPILRQDTTYATLMGTICLSTVFSSFLFWVGTPTYRRVPPSSGGISLADCRACCCADRANVNQAEVDRRPSAVASNFALLLASQPINRLESDFEYEPVDTALRIAPEEHQEEEEEHEEEEEEHEEEEPPAMEAVEESEKKKEEERQREEQSVVVEDLLDTPESPPSVWRIGSWVIATRRRDQKALLNIGRTFVALPLFWALFYQQNSTWVFQSNTLARGLFGWQIPPDILPSLNDLLVVLFVPLFDMAIYPLLDKCGCPLRPIQRLATGMLFIVFSFVLASALQLAIATSPTILSLAWQVPQYICISVAEVMVAVTGLEFAYSQSPPALRGMVTSLWYLTQAGGNLLVAAIAALELGSQAMEFLVYGLMMFIVLLLFLALTWGFEYYDEESSTGGSTGRIVEIFDNTGDGEELKVDGSL